MDPVNRNVFSHDYHQYVLQDLIKEVPPAGVEPQKKFNLNGADKSKKSKKESDEEKERDPRKKRPFMMD